MYNASSRTAENKPGARNKLPVFYTQAIDGYDIAKFAFFYSQPSTARMAISLMPPKTGGGGLADEGINIALRPAEAAQLMLMIEREAYGRAIVHRRYVEEENDNAVIVKILTVEPPSQRPEELYEDAYVNLGLVPAVVLKAEEHRTYETENPNSASSTTSRSAIVSLAEVRVISIMLDEFIRRVEFDTTGR